jgi:flagellar basal body-associated protein FliL
LFALLLISGLDINVALYRSILVFLVLFTLVYLIIFFMNIIKEDSEKEQIGGGERPKTPQQNGKNG